MSDRAGDCATSLEHLDVTDDKSLKCSAHLILGVDHAIDKVFNHKSVDQRPKTAAPPLIGVHRPTVELKRPPVLG